MAAVPHPETAPRPRRSQQLVADLLDLIQEGVVRPGTQLPTEAELSERFGVSRTVVREAIAQLRASGIVRSTQGKGTFVLAVPRDAPVAYAGEIDADDLGSVLELLEFRTANEVAAAELAARRRTGAQLGQIAGALTQFDASAEVPAAAVDADFAFHLAVARASGNPHFVALLESLGTGALAIPRARLLGDPHAHRRARDEHAAIHEAIDDADPVAAAAAMRAHLVNSRRRLQRG